MKTRYVVSIILVSLTAITVFAQPQKIVPSQNAFESKWLTNENYDMIWYVLKDTIKFEMGKVTTEIKITKDRLLAVTNVKMKTMNAPWVDSTLADLKTLKPIRHSSYNMQRDMVLNFGATVKGFYFDKASNVRTEINESVKDSYFDSNIYPQLIRWLPFSEGFTADIIVYDYNPSIKIGIMPYSVTSTKSGEYASEKSGIRQVWVATVRTEVGKDQWADTVYYIDKADRKIWKQEIRIGGRIMQMVRVER